MVRTTPFTTSASMPQKFGQMAQFDLMWTAWAEVFPGPAPDFAVAAITSRLTPEAATLPKAPIDLMKLLLPNSIDVSLPANAGKFQMWMSGNLDSSATDCLICIK